MDIQDCQSRMADRQSRRLEAFSYLPHMDEDRLVKQLQYAADNGWDCVVEHAEPDRAGDTYWYMWKLPLFGERDPKEILAEAAGCRRANPEHHVRIAAIDRKRQTIGLCVVVHGAEG